MVGGECGPIEDFEQDDLSSVEGIPWEQVKRHPSQFVNMLANEPGVIRDGWTSLRGKPHYWPGENPYIYPLTLILIPTALSPSPSLPQLARG